MWYRRPSEPQIKLLASDNESTHTKNEFLTLGSHSSWTHYGTPQEEEQGHKKLPPHPLCTLQANTNPVDLWFIECR